MERLTPLFRRVLATLPRWHENEKWLIKQEGGPKVSIRRHNLLEMTAEMVANPHAQVVDADTGQARPMTAAEVDLCLAHLVAKGWASVEADDAEEGVDARYWRMTQEGFEAIHAPNEDEANQIPGPVEIKPDPAVARDSASMRRVR